MILTGKFVFVSDEKRVGNDGKEYHNVNLESVDDGKMFRFGATPDAVSKMIKYRPHNVYLDLGTWDGKVTLRVVDAEAVAPAK